MHTETHFPYHPIEKKRLTNVTYAWRHWGLPLLAVASLLVAEPAPQSAETQTGTKVATPQMESEPNVLETLALLGPSTVILEVGNLKLTKREVQPLLRSLAQRKLTMLEEETSSSASNQVNRLFREHLEKTVQRGLFLLEAQAQNLQVTDEERRHYEAELETSLQASGQGITKEQFLKSFIQGNSTLTQLNYHDALRLQKLGALRQAKLTVTDAEMKQMTAYLTATNQMIQRLNDSKRENLEGARQEAKINTDAGFADIAREISEGIEAKNGGKLDYDFLRFELAEINELKTFPYQVGETTPVLETSSCFRLMRVLRELPPKAGEQEPRYRCAQILVGKAQVRDLSDTQAIRQEILIKKMKHDLLVYAVELSAKYPVRSVLFPQGILPKLERPQSAVKK